MIPGHENDDAKPYLERQVRNAVKGKPLRAGQESHQAR